MGQLKPGTFTIIRQNLENFGSLRSLHQKIDIVEEKCSSDNAEKTDKSGAGQKNNAANQNLLDPTTIHDSKDMSVSKTQSPVLTAGGVFVDQRRTNPDSSDNSS